MSDWKTYGLTRIFGNLRVRPKLMVLHNLFFLVLTCAAYFSLIPLFEKLVADSRAREISIVQQAPRVPAAGESAGSADVPEIAGKLSPGPYDEAVSRAKLTLFLVLGSIYVLAVLFLEWAIMPLYVYRPLRRMLQADAATQAGDRHRELIPAEDILGDEIGQIMRSRNQTVTELRRHEDELAAALSHVEAQDRLASLGLLSTSVAHEMNTPLAVLHGSIEKLIETVREPHAQDRLGRMLRVTRRLQKISEGLVDFARVRKAELEKVALRPLLEEAWSLVAIDEKASDVEFINQVGEAEAVAGNADRLVQVFVNLLRNALDAVGESGHISVSTKSCFREGKRWLAVSVEDDGGGIPPEVLPEIFDAFVTSRLDSRGTGLGLAVAEGIVHQHGGTITASNRPGGGARLEVMLRSAA